MSTGNDFWDQQQAALRETSRLFGEVGEVLGATEVKHAGWGEVTAVWRDTIVQNLEQRRMKSCQHLGLAPMQPTVIVAHKLGRMLCEDCSKIVLAAELNPVEEATCDGCGVWFEDGVYPLAKNLGNVIITGGLCDACRAREAGSW